MRFNLKKFLRCLGFSKVFLPVLIIQTLGLKDVHANDKVDVVFAPATVLSTGGNKAIYFSLINNVSYDRRIGKAYVPVHNVNFKFTPTKGDGTPLTWNGPPAVADSVMGGFTFLGGPGCSGASPFSFTCGIATLGAVQVGTWGVNYKLDPKIYSQDPYVLKNGTVKVKVEVSWTWYFGSWTQNESYTRFYDLPVSLDGVVEPTPVPVVPTATPTAVVPTATPTPIVVVPPPAPPALPPVAPNPNSGEICGNVISQESCDCLKCEDEDIFDLKAELVTKIRKAIEVARGAVATLAKYDIKKIPLAVRKAERTFTNSLADLNEVLEALGDTNLICESRQFCQDIINEDLLSDIEYIDDRILDISDSVRRALPNRLASSAKDKKSIRRASLDASYEVKDQLEEFPPTTSVCFETDAAVVCK